MPVTVGYSSLSDSDAEVRHIMASVANGNETSGENRTTSEEELILTNDIHVLR